MLSVHTALHCPHICTALYSPHHEYDFVLPGLGVYHTLYCPYCPPQENGFLYVHTPIITASDCEGAGEMFQVRGGGRNVFFVLGLGF